MSNFKMPTAYHPSNTEWVRPIGSLTSDGVRELQRLKDENDRLRELVADVHEALCSDKAGMFHKLILASMEDDMRELGVEVDG